MIQKGHWKKSLELSVINHSALQQFYLKWDGVEMTLWRHIQNMLKMLYCLN